MFFLNKKTKTTFLPWYNVVVHNFSDIVTYLYKCQGMFAVINNVGSACMLAVIDF